MHLSLKILPALFLFSNALAQVDGEGIRVNPNPQMLRSIEEAEAYAPTLIEGLGKDAILKITHVGESVPEPLKYLMIRLQREREYRLRNGPAFTMDFELIRPSDLEKDLDRAGEEAATALTQVRAFAEKNSDPVLTPLVIDESMKVTRSLPQKSKLFLKRVFGISGGFTLWGKYHRDWNKVKSDLKGATIPTLLAAPSIGLSLYPAVQAGAQANITAAVVSLCAWVGVNMYFKDEINELMSQGKRLTLGEKGKIRIGPSFLFGLLMQNVRGVLSNFVITIPAFGLESAFSGESLERNFENSLFNSFARHWVDRWIVMHFQTGKWNKRTFDIVFLTWNTIYPIAKNFHLFGLQGLGTNIYRTMAAIGVVYVFWRERHSMRQAAGNLWRRAFQRESGVNLVGMGCRGVFH